MQKQDLIAGAILAAAIVLAIGWYQWGQDAYAEHRARAHIRSLLLDPESAIFRHVRVWPHGVCGEVKGRNAFGGYASFRRFYASRDGELGDIEPDMPENFADSPFQASMVEHYRRMESTYCAPR